MHTLYVGERCGVIIDSYIRACGGGRGLRGCVWSCLFWCCVGPQIAVHCKDFTILSSLTKHYEAVCGDALYKLASWTLLERKILMLNYHAKLPR